MKAALVDSHRERLRRIETRRADRRRAQQVHRDRALAAPPGRRRRHPDRRPGGRDEQRDALERWRAERDQAAVDAALAELAPRRRRATRTSCRRRSPPRGRARRPASGRRRCASSFGEYRAPTGVGEAAAIDGVAETGRAARRGRPRQRGARAPDQDPRRQARPRRPLERRRADRGARARRGHGRRLRGHPPDARADRGERPPGGRHVIGLSILSGSHLRADPGGDRGAARARHRRAGRRRRDHPRGRRGAAEGRGRRRASTRRRTSTSRGSCATSSRSSQRATAPAQPRSRAPSRGP